MKHCSKEKRKMTTTVDRKQIRLGKGTPLEKITNWRQTLDAPYVHAVFITHEDHQDRHDAMEGARTCGKKRIEEISNYYEETQMDGFIVLFSKNARNVENTLVIMNRCTTNR